MIQHDSNFTSTNDCVAVESRIIESIGIGPVVRINLQQHQQQSSSHSAAAIYLMVDPCQVPNLKGQHIHIFNLHDGIRHIIGYCLPLKQCVELFKTIQPARAIKTLELNSQLYEQFTIQFKFIYPPLNVAPVNDKDYHEMMKSPPIPCRNQPLPVKNRFFVRQLSPPNPMAKKLQPFDDSAMNFVMEKFKLHLNPHLIPYRLPDGLDCFIRLELASHCQYGIFDTKMNLRQSYHYAHDNYQQAEAESMIRKNGGGRHKFPSSS